MRFCRFSANHPAANAKLASTVTLTPGYAATEREREKGFRTPIIFITAYLEIPAASLAAALCERKSPLRDHTVRLKTDGKMDLIAFTE